MLLEYTVRFWQKMDIQGLSKNIRRLLSGYSIRTAFKSSWTLERMLTKVKDPVPPEERTGVVHKIRCICGDVAIIKKHEAACRLPNIERSAITKHAWQDGHSFEWDNVEILDTAMGSISMQIHKRSSSYKALDNS